MKRLMISALAAVALFAATTATAMLWSPSTKLSAGTAMPSLHELHTAAGANKLPIEDFEDMSLVYSTVTMRAKYKLPIEDFEDMSLVYSTVTMRAK